MLSNIRLKSPSSFGQPQTEFIPGAVTVLVGPNNSGKSMFLLEIEGKLGAPDQVSRIIEQIGLKPIPQDAIDGLVLATGQPAEGPNGRTASVGRLGTGRGPGNNFSFSEKDGHWHFSEPAPSRLALLFSSRLDGRTRLSLLDNVKATSLQIPPPDYLNALFRDHQIRKKLSDLAFEAFGLYLTVDPTGMDQFAVQLSSRAPVDLDEECGLTERSIQFHKAAQSIGTFSDGVKAYLGILAAALATELRLILVDEPEAFLHPPLAHRLGRHLGEVAAKRDGSVIAATHSADFLMGAVQSGATVTVVRLTFQASVATSRVLAHDQLQILMSDPLLRSTGVLRALFHIGAIVCEADTDRAFYQECNERLSAHSGDGANDTLFLNANGKHTVRRIVSPLRAIGIPAAALVDFDIFKDEGLITLLSDSFIPEPDFGMLSSKLVQVQSSFSQIGASLDSDGISTLKGKLPEIAESLVSDLCKYGIFVVPVGDVEDWQKSLGISVRKKLWLPTMLSAMGSEPTDPQYVKPGSDDVWAFLRNIAKWIADPTRRGMPI